MAHQGNSKLLIKAYCIHEFIIFEQDLQKMPQHAFWISSP